MKLTTRLLLIITVVSVILAGTSCGKDKTNKKEPEKTKDSIETVTKPEEKKEIGTDKNTDETPMVVPEETDVQKAEKAVNAYVEAAKKLDFDTMNKYISDSKTLPILDSYTEAYSKYGISESRIKELSKAMLGTYKIVPVAAAKNGSGVKVSVKISRVNMESLQNKWLETLGNEYPEYTNLTEEQMTSKTVDVLIQVMIDVLKNAETSIEEQKDFIVENKNGSWVIKAKNEDFFPAN